MMRSFVSSPFQPAGARSRIACQRRFLLIVGRTLKRRRGNAAQIIE